MKIQFQAPSALMKGYPLQVQVENGQVQTIRLPKNVVHGELVKMKTQPSNSFGKSVNTPVQEATVKPWYQGRFRTGICGCCNVCCSALWWITCCCPCIPLGQLFVRLGLNALGGPVREVTRYGSAARTTFTIVVGLYGAYHVMYWFETLLFNAYICQPAVISEHGTRVLSYYNDDYSYGGYPSSYGSNSYYYDDDDFLYGSSIKEVYYETKPECEIAGTILWVVVLVFGLFWLVVLTRVRGNFRRRHNIREGCCGDCCLSDCCCIYWCGCCSIIQMMRQAPPQTLFPYDCCTIDGLPEAPLLGSQDREARTAVAEDITRDTQVGAFAKREISNPGAQDPIHKAKSLGAIPSSPPQAPVKKAKADPKKPHSWQVTLRNGSAGTLQVGRESVLFCVQDEEFCSSLVQMKLNIRDLKEVKTNQASQAKSLLLLADSKGERYMFEFAVRQEALEAKDVIKSSTTRLGPASSSGVHKQANSLDSIPSSPPQVDPKKPRSWHVTFGNGAAGKLGLGKKSVLFWVQDEEAGGSIAQVKLNFADLKEVKTNKGKPMLLLVDSKQEKYIFEFAVREEAVEARDAVKARME